MNEDEDEFEFEMPRTPPQLEVEAGADLITLLETAPAWEGNFALELVVLARRHIAVRSMLGFALELAKAESNKLVAEDKPEEIYRAQGACRALQRHHEVIFEAMTKADNWIASQKEKEVDEDEYVSQAP